MAKSSAGQPRLPPPINPGNVDSSNFPGLLSKSLGGPARSMKPRKNPQKVDNVAYDTDPLQIIIKKLRELASSQEKKAARDYRFSQLREEMEGVIPELMQYTRGGDTNVVRTKQESDVLQQIIQTGTFLTEASRTLNRVSTSLSNIIEELGKAMQGING